VHHVDKLFMKIVSGVCVCCERERETERETHTKRSPFHDKTVTRDAMYVHPVDEFFLKNVGGVCVL